MENTTESTVSERKPNKFFITLELFAVIAFIVVQNVYSILPVSEIPYVLLIAWASLRLRGGGWASTGLRRPASWLKVVGVALVAGVFLQILSEFVTEPVIAYFTGKPADLSDFRPLVGNVTLLLVYFVAIWTLAAFGEELVYRGYIMNRMAEIGDRTSLAWALSLILVSSLFGIGHYYQGVSGMIGSGISSLVFAGAYFATGRNLWTAILAHGFSDTIALLLIFSGVSKV